MIYLLALVVLVASLFIGSAILAWITSLFKIQNASYKKSLVILIVSGVVSCIFSIVFRIINLGLLSNLLVTLVTFFSFYYFLKKYYQVNWKKALGVYLVFAIMGSILVLIFIIPVRLYVAETFIVNGDTMSPTYQNNQYLLVNKFNKQFSRGNVIVFKTDNPPGAILIKRIVGLPGEKVDIQNGKVLINGQILNESYYNGETIGNMSVILMNDQYFVLGDNRVKSFDSRNFGPVLKSSIQGKVF